MPYLLFLTVVPLAPTMSRTIKQILKLTLPAGQASPSPPVGPRLGQMGVNIVNFCKDFNAATANYQPGTPLTTKITAYTDRSATFTLRTPPTSYLLKRAAGVEKGATHPGRSIVGSVSLKHIYAIAHIKRADLHLSHLDMEAMCRMVASTAKSCGIAIDPPPPHMLHQNQNPSAE